MKEKYQGCLVGLACGDAVGVTVEFQPRGSFEPVTDMVGGGPFDLNPGEWTDDTSMALCLAESLLAANGFDARDQIKRYVRWWREGYLSSTGTCFDIGNTVREALERYETSGEPFSGSTHPKKAGNGSIMRLAPIPMFFQADLNKVIYYSGESSKTTHAAREAVDSCRLFGMMIARAVGGCSKEEILTCKDEILDSKGLSPKIQDIYAGTYKSKPMNEILGSGYVVKSLEAALWCFYHAESYRETVLKAVNLGGDTDTTGAIAGQIAGAYYGIGGIPSGWVQKLTGREMLKSIAGKLFEGRIVD